MQRCHTYKIAVSKYRGRCEQRSENFFLGGVGLGGQSGCELRIEVFVKIQKKKFGGGGGGGGGRGGSVGGGVRVDVNKELKFL